MTHSAQSEGRNATRRSFAPVRAHPTWLPTRRECPWCGSRDTVFVQRGLDGGQESKDQYIQCQDCETITYDIVATNDRDIRANGYHTDGVYRDSTHQIRYIIYRMLKVGFNEFLLYVRPILPNKDAIP